jgi:hypothetical protein
MYEINGRSVNQDEPAAPLVSRAPSLITPTGQLANYYLTERVRCRASSIADVQLYMYQVSSLSWIDWLFFLKRRQKLCLSLLIKKKRIAQLINGKSDENRPKTVTTHSQADYSQNTSR